MNITINNINILFHRNNNNYYESGMRSRFNREAEPISMT